jgi:predicted permease
MRWLVRRLVSDADRRAIESERAELFELIRRRDGDRAAARWLRRQERLYPLHLFMDRLRAILGDWTATMPHFWRDVMYSVRSLVRTPVLTATIVLTVGIGLGATTAMLGVIRGVLLNPLPYAAPESLVWIYTNHPPNWYPFSVVDYRALEADHPSFTAVSGYQTRPVTVTDAGSAEQVVSRAVTGSYFGVLGQSAVLGRVFDPSDDAKKERTVVLTHAYWTRRFGANPGVIGRTITIDAVSYTIVGVLQPAPGPLEHNIALFTPADWPQPQRKGPFFIRAIARLAPGVSRAAALETLHATNRRLFPLWKSSYQDEKATWGMQDLKERAVGNVRSMLFFVLVAVACVLLIACANAINLLIARALSRTRELAIRSALGASRARLLQHLVVEAGLLTIAAALMGLGVAAGAIKLVAAYGVDYIPRTDEIRLAGPVLVWLAGLSAASGLLIGLVPAIQSSRVRVDNSLRSSGRASTDGPATRRIRGALVAAEFALATPLIVAAALVMTSLDRLNRVDIGMDMGRVLTAGTSLPTARYAEPADRRAFWKRARDRFSGLPGVESVAMADSRPPEDAGNQNNFDLQDHPTLPGQSQPVCTWVAVSPEFFKTAGLRLERGRLLDEHSGDDNVIVVDRAWANRFFPGEEVLGRRMHEGGCTSCPWTTVVGLVNTVKFAGIDAPDPGTVYYLFDDFRTGYFVLKSSGSPAALTSDLRQALRELDPALPLTSVATGDDLVAQSLAQPRYLSVLVGMFALAALVLSIVGIYGVMAHFVQQHSRDIGIRLALGGEPSGVRRMVVLRGLRLVAAGVVAGVAAAFLTGRLMTTVLFGVSPSDPRTMVAVPLALLLVAAIACLAPARRAATVDPAKMLRES